MYIFLSIKLKNWDQSFTLFSLDGDCYEDSSSRLLGGLFKEDARMTPEFCKKICFEDNDFKYAGVQNAYECFCGSNSLPSSKLLPKSQCNTMCLGDSSKMCGGGWKMNIFKNKGTVVKLSEKKAK